MRTLSISTTSVGMTATSAKNCVRSRLRASHAVPLTPRATGKEKKKVTKQTQQAQAAADAASDVSAVAIKDALLKIREEEIPPTPDEKEGYFMMQVQIGDQLVQKGVW